MVCLACLGGSHNIISALANCIPLIQGEIESSFVVSNTRRMSPRHYSIETGYLGRESMFQEATPRPHAPSFVMVCYTSCIVLYKCTIAIAGPSRPGWKGSRIRTITCVNSQLLFEISRISLYGTAPNRSFPVRSTAELTWSCFNPVRIRTFGY